MSADAAPLPNSPGPFPVGVPAAQSSSVWDRITNWASEHKGTVYAIAGVTLVVTAAGTIYYLSDSNKEAASPGGTPTNKRKSKRDRKKAKERAEKEAIKDESKPGRRNVWQYSGLVLTQGQRLRRLLYRLRSRMSSQRWTRPALGR
jgi:import receptor subunit TOM70